MTFAGVDGYPRGWLVLRCALDRHGRMRIVELEGHSGFRSVLRLPEKLVVVDMPIGLAERPEDGPRRCDVEARRLLGDRGASVFPAPARSTLTAGTFAEAKALGPMNLQTFGILRRVAEVDQLMEPALQSRIREGHPELAFRELAGNTTALRSKTSAEGRAQRCRLLTRLGLDCDALIARRPAGAGEDDVLDAAAMVLTAARIRFEQARPIPPDAPTDAKGLRMEMWV